MGAAQAREQVQAPAAAQAVADVIEPEPEAELKPKLGGSPPQQHHKPQPTAPAMETIESTGTDARCASAEQLVPFQSVDRMPRQDV